VCFGKEDNGLMNSAWLNMKTMTNFILYVKQSSLISIVFGTLALMGSSLPVAAAETIVWHQPISISSKSKQPTDATSYYLRGLDRFKDEDYRNAIADFDESLRLSKNKASIFLYLHRGRARAKLGDHTAAIADYNETLKLNSLFPPGYYWRGWSQLERGEYQLAIRDYDKAIELEPTLAQPKFENYSLVARRKLNLPIDKPTKPSGGTSQATTTVTNSKSTTSPATPATNVYKVATQTTVLIDGQGSGTGSGVIISRNGNTYYVLTAKHVVEGLGRSTVMVFNGKEYPLDNSQSQKLADLDLAIVQFRSSETFDIPPIGNSKQVNQGENIYVSGWPAIDQAITKPSHLVTEGRIAGIRPGNSDGYELLYSNSTGPGMSGGPIFDSNGRVIGIHGRAAGNPDRGKVGINLGIPIHLFLQNVPRGELNLKSIGSTN
jgi:S1-C subfamily serine protease